MVVLLEYIFEIILGAFNFYCLFYCLFFLCQKIIRISHFVYNITSLVIQYTKK